MGARCLRRKDAEFVNTEAHDATAGRYMSYWAWQEGKPQQSVMTDYNTETASGSGDWYMVPSRDKAAESERTVCL